MTRPAHRIYTAQTQRPSPILVAFLITFAALIGVSAAHLFDPMVRHDDFPALLADPTEYYEKTLTEGRWLNWLWHLRPFGGPAIMHYALYQMSWALFAAAASVNALGRDAPLWYIVALSLLIAVAPPATLISAWFNTTLPGFALLVLYAVLSTQLTARPTYWLLLLFVPATFMAYTTHPILLLLVCLTRAQARPGLCDLVAICLIFGAGFILAILLTYTINLRVHGVFGVEIAAWRDPSPARDLASLLSNAELFVSVLVRIVHDLAFRSWELAGLQLGLFCTGFVVFFQNAPGRAAYLGVGLLAGLGLLGLQVVMTGIATPTRAAIFLWMIFALVFIQLSIALERRGGPVLSAVRIALIFTIALYGILNIRHYAKFTTWQTETRALAADLPQGEGPVYVTGNVMSVPGAEQANIQAPRGLRLRLRYLTGERFVICSETPPRCEAAKRAGGPMRLLRLPQAPADASDANM